MENRYRIPKQIIKGFIVDGTKKSQSKKRNIFIMGCMAGMFIAFGACCSSAAMFGIKDPGMAKLVAGTIFPVGLMLIILVGGELFTGDCLMIMGALDKKYRAATMLYKLVVVFVSNMIGAAVVVVLVYFSGQLNMSDGTLGAYAIKVAYTKVNMNYSAAFTSAILCNILVCLAVLMAYSATDVTGKVFAVFFPILAFVVGGFEHCVANMYYIPVGMLSLNNETYKNMAMKIYGLTESHLSTLNIGNYVTHSILPVTLGNVIGGMLFIGVPLYVLYKNQEKIEKESNIQSIGKMYS